jgi:hypothetical protein
MCCGVFSDESGVAIIGKELVDESWKIRYLDTAL